ncbi:MAG: type II secretion system F family protein [candidate division KSB1 bacterium]|nr:type II secretion system F family protein [candidate division KSB1 bacterium]MDZ7346900.1 type II secretion system F family protein [candidate division KSB1 bacterium]
MTILIVIFVFSTSFVLFAAILLKLSHRFGSGPVIKKRMSEYEKAVVEIKEKEKELSLIRDESLSEIPLLNKILEHLNLAKKLSRLIEQAGLSIRVGQLVLLMFVSGAVGFMLTLRSTNILFKGAATGAMFYAPMIYVLTKRKARLHAFIRGFPDAIDMINGALRAGHAFPRALQMVAEEATDPISVEFRRTVEEYNLGATWQLAFNHLLERIDSADLRLFVTAVLLQRETGGNLNEILENIGTTIRERFKLMGKMRTFTAQGRMSGWILGALPIAFILIISMMSPGYLSPMFHRKIGQYMLVTAGILQGIGFYMINKIIEVKYQ